MATSRPTSRGRGRPRPRPPPILPVSTRKVTGPPNLPHLTVDGKQYPYTGKNDLQQRAFLGKGAFGVVDEYLHVPTRTRMAVKRIPYTSSGEEQKKQLKELDVSMRSSSCAYTVTCYGALFLEGDVWICMELVDTSLDKFYPLVYRAQSAMREDYLAHIAFSVVSALDYLESELRVIHRDVKPSNILVHRTGRVKLCDFGISGMLVNSTAATNIGSQLYMAPERIEPPADTSEKPTFTIKSDVWSLGVCLLELSIGRFPYNDWGSNFFQHLEQVVKCPPPKLPDGRFSPQYEHFMESCLVRNKDERHNYKQLLGSPFLVLAKAANTDMGVFVREVLDDTQEQAK